MNSFHRHQLRLPKSASKATSMAHTTQPRREKLLEAEVAILREQLKQANMEKNEINSEYEKLSTICRSQRQQLHGIKQALASSTPPNKTASKSQSSPTFQQHVLINKSCSSPDENSWQAFPEDLKKPTTLLTSVITRNRSPINVPVTNMNQSQCSSDGSRNNLTSQPPGWAAF